MLSNLSFQGKNRVWTAQSIREDFPILNTCFLSASQQPMPLVYLDNAATSQKPRQVIQAIQNYYTNENANVHRSIHRLGEEATRKYEASRCKIAQFLGARSEQEIIFTKGTTEAINLVADTWGNKFLQPGEAILIPESEHHSNLIPWQILAKNKKLQLKFWPISARGVLDMSELPELLKDVKLVTMAHISNALGTIHPIQEIIQLAHAQGAIVFIDAAQSIPHFPIDVQNLDCDFLAFSGHKMCGPNGIGILYGKQSLLEQMPPYQSGGDMIQSVWLDHAQYQKPPHRFEAGTPPICEAISLGEAVEYLQALGMNCIAQYEHELTQYAIQELQKVGGLTLYSNAPQQSGVLSFQIDDIHPHDVAQFLDFEGIAVRAGHHCAQPLMRKLGINGTVRASLYFYNVPSEIDKLILSIDNAKDFFWCH